LIDEDVKIDNLKFVSKYFEWFYEIGVF
jgi:hypothetical protein